MTYWRGRGEKWSMVIQGPLHGLSQLRMTYAQPTPPPPTPPPPHPHPTPALTPSPTPTPTHPHLDPHHHSCSRPTPAPAPASTPTLGPSSAFALDPASTPSASPGAAAMGPNLDRRAKFLFDAIFERGTSRRPSIRRFKALVQSFKTPYRWLSGSVA